MHRVVLLLLTLLLAAATAAAQAPAAVRGPVVDQTGGLPPQARVELVGSSGAVVQTSTTDEAGQFTFAAVPPGRYELRASFQGFRPGALRLRVGARSPGVQKVVLALADVKEGVTVSRDAGQVDTSASNNLSAVTIDQQMLEGSDGPSRSGAEALPRRWHSIRMFPSYGVRLLPLRQ
jgi:Carboxypeptidase regulatory-like domain